MSDIPSPQLSTPGGATSTEVLDTLRLVDQWSMTETAWWQVHGLLVALESSHATGDRQEFARAYGELARIGLLQARRFGGPEDPDARPLPPPVRERRNTLVHRLGIPTGTADSSAGTGNTADTVGGGRSAMTRTARWWSERAFLRLPAFDRAAVALASSADQHTRDVPSQQAVIDETLVIRRSENPNTVEVVIVAAPGARPGDVLALASGPERESTVLLLPLWPDQGRLVSAVQVPTAAISLDDAITTPFPSTWLDHGDAEIVARSVRLTGRNGRNAWREIALARQSGDPVRAAVVEGLR